MDHTTLFADMTSAILQGKMTELEAERLLNAMARLESHTPTGVRTSAANRVDRE